MCPLASSVPAACVLATLRVTASSLPFSVDPSRTRSASAAPIRYPLDAHGSEGIGLVRAVTSLGDYPGACAFFAAYWLLCLCFMSAVVCRFVTASFWTAFVNSLAMILVCEIGDKTFFIGAIMAMQHPPVLVRTSQLSIPHPYSSN
jgi:hypothetical protein